MTSPPPPVPSWVNSPTPIKGLMLDISGVLRDGGVAIPGSIQAFQRLIDSSLPVRLVTNESQVTSSESLSKLVNLGFNLPPHQQIFAPAPLLAQELGKTGSKVYLLVHPDVQAEFEHLEQSQTPDCVVIGDAAKHFTYDNMNNAFRALLSMKERDLTPKLYSLGRGRYYMEDGELWLDVGPFCAALEYGVGIKAEVFGKPSPAFFQAALSSMNLLPSEVVMIGDDILGDVQGAMDVGMRGVLVRTGKFRPQDEHHPTTTPTAIVDNLAAAVDAILGQSTT